MRRWSTWARAEAAQGAIIEQAFVVKDRMDITGARWGLNRAEAILKLRSLKISGDLPAYLAFHFAQEHNRNYPRSRRFLRQ